MKKKIFLFFSIFLAILTLSTALTFAAPGDLRQPCKSDYTCNGDLWCSGIQCQEPFSDPGQPGGKCSSQIPCVGDKLCRRITLHSEPICTSKADFEGYCEADEYCHTGYCDPATRRCLEKPTTPRSTSSGGLENAPYIFDRKLNELCDNHYNPNLNPTLLDRCKGPTPTNDCCELGLYCLSNPSRAEPKLCQQQASGVATAGKTCVSTTDCASSLECLPFTDTNGINMRTCQTPPGPPPVQITETPTIEVPPPEEASIFDPLTNFIANLFGQPASVAGPGTLDIGGLCLDTSQCKTGLVCPAGTCIESAPVITPEPCAPGQEELFGLASNTNAHAAKYPSSSDYPIKVCWTKSPLPNPRTCTGTNTLLRLNADSDAHAASAAATTYPTQVCYGDLRCTTKTSDCTSADGACVARLSGTSDAHISKECTDTGAPIRVCCKSATPPPPPTGTANLGERCTAGSTIPTKMCKPGLTCEQGTCVGTTLGVRCPAEDTPCAKIGTTLVKCGADLQCGGNDADCTPAEKNSPACMSRECKGTYSKECTAPPRARTSCEPLIKNGLSRYCANGMECPASGTCLTGPDTIPPALTHMPVTTAQQNTAITISATATDSASGIKTVTLYSRNAGTTTYTPTVMQQQGTTTTYRATLLATTTNLNYYIEAEDRADNKARKPLSTATPPYYTIVISPPQCMTDTQCSAGKQCINGACVAVTPECTVDADCGVGKACVSETQTCVSVPQCTSDAQCDPQETCDLASKTCAPRPECGQGQTKECATQQTCAGKQLCSTTNEWLACADTNADDNCPTPDQLNDCTDIICPQGQVCDFNLNTRSCTTGCNVRSDCASGQLCVDGQCTTQDKGLGASCGVALECNTGLTCTEGKCTAPAAPTDPDGDQPGDLCSLSNPCHEGFTCSEGRCTQDTDGDKKPDATDLDPLDPDIDGDGILDGSDHCVTVPDPTNQCDITPGEGISGWPSTTCIGQGGLVCSEGETCTTDTIADDTDVYNCCLKGDDGEDPQCSIDQFIPALSRAVSITRTQCADPDRDGQGTIAVTISGITDEAELDPLTPQDLITECASVACDCEGLTCNVACTKLPTEGETRTTVPYYTIGSALLTLALISCYYLFRRKRKL